MSKFWSRVSSNILKLCKTVCLMNTSLVMYINGTLTTTVSRSYANTTNNSLRIGAGATESSAQFFLVYGTLLDDFRFYEGALSDSQVNNIYSN